MNKSWCYREKWMTCYTTCSAAVVLPVNARDAMVAIAPYLDPAQVIMADDGEADASIRENSQLAASAAAAAAAEIPQVRAVAYSTRDTLRGSYNGSPGAEVQRQLNTFA